MESHWFHNMHCLPHLLRLMQLLWTATRGNGYRSDIALDEILVMTMSCEDTSPPQTTVPPVDGMCCFLSPKTFPPWDQACCCRWTTLGVQLWQPNQQLLHHSRCQHRLHMDSVIFRHSLCRNWTRQRLWQQCWLHICWGNWTQSWWYC